MAAASDAVINADTSLRMDLVAGRTAFESRLLEMPTRREIDFSDTAVSHPHYHMIQRSSSREAYLIQVKGQVHQVSLCYPYPLLASYSKDGALLLSGE
ncbi:hypothetical protein PHISCL_01184 [Aspergillus sclerotialis]|uniref:Uncharacterized protein n=1 Tax=Aspergillus sclerotialis TaxID=2070753 RepID=A0A3A3A431_9EURO|nr:hypothetical protein PHISCL_01184 [Aspergillus sclerotialis]